MRRAVFAECLGSALLFATVVGSGIMAERLSGGNDGVALLANTAATSAILFVLISMIGPISGAHFNPAVTLVMRLQREIPTRSAVLYVIAQLLGGIAGVWIAHAMFDVPIVQFSDKARTGVGQWTSELVATFGLIFTIMGTVKARPTWVPASVALYICAAYWFTASTSFANPAITVARSLTNSFAGIACTDVPAFIAAQCTGAVLALLVGRWLFSD